MIDKIKDKIMKAESNDEIANLVGEYIEKTLRENYIKTLVQGFEIAMTMLKEYCDDHEVAEIKKFCEQNLTKKSLKTLEKVISKERKEI